jgi:ACS family hexuronate transporter-like MFS transporter
VTTSRTTAASASAVSSIANLRWVICGLLLFGIAVNYIDRQTFGILAPQLQREIGWSELQYGRLVNAFQIPYAVMLLAVGWIIDRVGTRWGLALGMIWWSVAEMAHAFAGTVTQFGVARFFLGAGEAAGMPGSVKAIGEWFPKQERATATGLLNAATAVGSIVAPIIVPLTAATAYGWKGAFVVTGAIGAVWLVGWLALYQHPSRHHRLSSTERAFIEEGVVEKTEPVSWVRLLGYRQLWAYAGSRIITDPVYWFFLYWTPKYLAESHNIRGTAVIPYLTTVYIITAIGSMLGGYLSSALIQRGWTVNRARKTAMFLMASIIPSVIFAQGSGAWTAAILIGVALAVHQGWAANNFTLILDMFPTRAAATVWGLGGCIGLLSGIAAAEVIGQILQRDPSYYLPMFIFSGFAYLAGTLWIHVLVPRLERAEI